MSRSVDLGDEAAGSGFGDDQRMLNGGRGVATRGMSAGVLAREEECRNSRVARGQVRHMVVQADPPPEFAFKKPHNIKQKRRNRKVREMYDLLGKWRVIWG